MVGRTELLRISKQAAQVLRSTGASERYQHLGYTRVDPFEIAAVADVAVMLRPLQDLLGAFVRETQAGILVNSDRPPGLVHMTCAHELGHYFLGHQTTMDRQLDYGPDANSIEKEADWFAYQLLMPRHLIADIIRRKGWSDGALRDPAIIYQLSLRLGTSYSATVWALHRLNILNVSAQEAQTIARATVQNLKRSLMGLPTEETLSDVWVLDKADHDLILEPRPSDRFVVDLPSHAAAGYLWSLHNVSDAGFTLHPVTVVSEPVPSDRDLIVGGPGQQRYTLDHVGDTKGLGHVDRVQLNFEEQQPWRPNEAPHDTFRTSTEFENIAQGLSIQSRERLIEEVTSS